MRRRRFAFRFLVFCAVCCCSFFTASVHGQISNTGNQNTVTGDADIVSDTLGFAEKADDNSVQIFYKNSSGERNEYDTSITEMHRINLLNNWERDLGNLGGAYQSLKAQAELPAQFTLMPSSFEAFRFLKKDVLFYNTTKPFSEVRYNVGTKQEQLIELFHTQNIKPYWNFSTRYRKINSQGFYKVQKNNIDNFSFVTDYASRSERYKANATFLYNKLQQDENLGILSDEFLTIPAFNNREVIPVGANVSGTLKRSPIVNFSRDAHVTFNQEYSVGQTTITYDADSLKQTNFKPILTFGNEIYYKNELDTFMNSSPDSIFRAFYFNQPYELNDTLGIAYRNKIFGTNFSAEGNVYFRERIFSVLGGLGFEYQKVGGDVRSQSSVNNYIFGQLSNRKSQDSSWKVDANLRFYYTGMAQGNLNLDGRLSKELPQGLGEIGVRAGQYIQQPYFVSESIQTDSLEKLQDLKPQINTRLGGYYKNNKLRFEASVYSLLFNQLIYSNGLQPNFLQYNSPISITQITASKTVNFGQWTNNNEVLLQLSPANTPLQIPLLSSWHRLAYNGKIFKKKMDVSTGLDVYFNTPYYNDIYQPVFQSFNPQTSVKKQMIPRINPFFNFKIKRFRATINFDQVQHYFVKNNLNYINYAAQNPMFRFGLRWLFVN